MKWFPDWLTQCQAIPVLVGGFPEHRMQWCVCVCVCVCVCEIIHLTQYEKD